MRLFDDFSEVGAGQMLWEPKRVWRPDSVFSGFAVSFPAFVYAIWKMVHPSLSFCVVSFVEKADVLFEIVEIMDVDQSPGSCLVVSLNPSVEALSERYFSDMMNFGESSAFLNLVSKEIVWEAVLVVSDDMNLSVFVADDSGFGFHEPSEFFVCSLFVYEIVGEDMLYVFVSDDVGVFEAVESRLWHFSFVDKQSSSG